MFSARLSSIINRRTGAVLTLLVALFFFAQLSSVPVSALECPKSDVKLTLKGCCCEEKPAAPVPVADDLCTTEQTSVAITDRDTLSIFSGRTDGNPNGLLVTRISLQSIRAVTDAEKALNQAITLVSKDSEVTDDGWHIELYWFNNHYGVIVTGPNGFYDDTANCITL